jgi:hypothetical protein
MDARIGVVVRIGARQRVEAPLDRAVTAPLSVMHEEG